MVAYIKAYLEKLADLLKENKPTVVFLISLALILFIVSIFSGILSFLVIKTLLILFILSYVFQFLFLIKNSYSFYLVRVIIIVFLGFEIFTGAKNYYTEGSIRDRGDFVAQDSIISWRLKPNINSEKSIQIFQGDTISIGTYTSDNYSRRISDVASSFNNEANKNHNKHAIFLGCSFTFGSGLPYSSTFPYIFEKLNTDYKSYNYGYKAYGPHHISLLFNDGIDTINNSTVEESEGFALYTYIDAHLGRVYGGSDQSIGSPNVFIENGTHVVKERSFAHKISMLFIKNSATLRFFNISYSYPRTESFYKRFADIINYSAQKYWDLKPQGYFYVGIFPGIHAKETAWTDYLDENIIVLHIDSPSDYETNFEDYVIHPKVDIHPDKLLNDYYVDQIMKLIN